MNLSASGRTWDEASSPAALGLARRFEADWRAGRRPDLAAYLAEAADRPGARLALLRAELGLRWENGERPGIASYRERFPDLAGETLVALIYEEFCLREEAGEEPDTTEYLQRHAEVAPQLRRVLDIHGLVGAGSLASTASHAPASLHVSFPRAGETIAGFRLVEELGRGAFARVFRAEERQLADRPVALKVARTGSREPQTLARLQHTHIVPVHSYRTDPATGLHLLCMPYFGRVTLARLLADPRARQARSGSELVEALDRLGVNEPPPTGRSAGRAALIRRDYAQAIAWWGARMAEALEHAHDHGVLHRDVKPSNVLVTRDGLPMLLDFNLAREAVVEGEDAERALPGGTLDYMSPEHLEELADGVADRVDARSDVFGLGVLLYEALAGARPFATPRNAASAASMLLAAAEERRGGPPRLRDARPEVPAALAAVVQHCLEPDPADRYASAADLAADLQAVADDRPLRFAREPWPDRIYRFARRRRRALAAFVPAVLAALLAGVLLVREQLDRSRTIADVRGLFEAGVASEEAGDFAKAMVQFEAAARLAERPDARELGRQVVALRQARPTGAWSGLEELQHQARQRFRNAERTGQVRSAADALFTAADGLRFRLTGFGADLRASSVELLRVLEPFFVFGRENWLKRADLGLLDPARKARLTRDVDELLFLWAVALDREADLEPGPQPPQELARAREALGRGIEVCDRALGFTALPASWQALRERLARRRDRVGAEVLDVAVAAEPGPVERPEEDVAAGVSSPLGCFEWGALRLREARFQEASAWFRKAVRLDPGNDWYQYLLAYTFDQMPGMQVEALRHYDVAAALRPGSPWVRFSRARLYRARGAWSLALDDLQRCLSDSRARDGAPVDLAFERQTRLELGLVRQSLGDLEGARREYAWVIASGPSGEYARAARLNRAKLDADDGQTARARAEYDALVNEQPSDRDALRGRALLSLRLGQTEQAEADLTGLAGRGSPPQERAEALAFRALARLARGRPEDALADADASLAIRSKPWVGRLRVRALVALGRADALALAGPGDLESLPLRGRALQDDLARLRDRLTDEARRSSSTEATPGSSQLRAVLNLASVRSALGDARGALEQAGRAVTLAPLSARVYLARAAIARRADRSDQALQDVERARGLEPDNPRVWELRGVLRAESGDLAGGLADLDRALALGEETPELRGRRAQVLLTRGEARAAVEDWSRALTHDPEDPGSYLGRAEAFLRLGQWDAVLADLEQAAGWSDGRPGLAPRIVFAYVRCLSQRPDRLARLIAIVRRLWVVESAGDQAAPARDRPPDPSPS